MRNPVDANAVKNRALGMLRRFRWRWTLFVVCAGGAALSVAWLLIILLAPPFGFRDDDQPWGDDPDKSLSLQLQVLSADGYASAGSQAFENGERLKSTTKFFSALIMLPRNELTADRVKAYQTQFWRNLTDW